VLALLALLGMQQRLILSEPVGSLRAWVWTQARTAQRAQLKIHKIQSLGGNIRGARRGVLRILASQAAARQRTTNLRL